MADICRYVLNKNIIWNSAPGQQSLIIFSFIYFKEEKDWRAVLMRKLLNILMLQYFRLQAVHL